MEELFVAVFADWFCFSPGEVRIFNHGGAALSVLEDQSASGGNLTTFLPFIGEYRGF